MKQRTRRFLARSHTFIAVQASRQAEILTRDAELRALKAQINPHFLFNSLNSIAALAVSDGPKARDVHPAFRFSPQYAGSGRA
jgi:LytS/YehU family sensor histidine kinase